MCVCSPAHYGRIAHAHPPAAAELFQHAHLAHEYFLFSALQDVHAPECMAVLSTLESLLSTSLMLARARLTSS